jgi:hypothetical protein
MYTSLYFAVIAILMFTFLEDITMYVLFACNYANCSANAIKVRTFTISTIAIHRPQLYTICFVSDYLHTQFNVLEPTGHYLLCDRNLIEQAGSSAICWG